ncbi:MAG: hypothetical protein ABH846_04840 [Patescibacteria group bacterium]
MSRGEFGPMNERLFTQTCKEYEENENLDDLYNGRSVMIRHIA